MSDVSPDQPHGERAADTPPGAPRWVKVLGLVALGVIVLFVILKLAGLGGNHGPGMHSAPATDTAHVTGAA